MSTSYYYTGTDYSSMHPWHYEFWYHIFIPWTWHNWVMLAMLVLYIWVKLNDAFVSNRIE